MVAMASDSYLLKVPPPPCQARCRGGDQQSTSSCEVAMVVTLVVLVAGILSLAGTVFYLHMELGRVQAYTIQLEARLKVIDTKLSHLNYIEQLRAFENPAGALDHGDLSDLDEEDEDEEDDDFLPYYQDEENDGIIERRVRDEQDEDTTVQPLQPAGSLLGRSLGVDATSSPLTPGSNPFDENIGPEEAPLDNHEAGRQAQPIQSPVQFPSEAATLRQRRDAQQPQLKLYHTLQVPAAPPAESWSPYGSHRPQPMYAERAPTGFVTPPRPSAALLGTTPAAPIASRRSRVMDAERAPRRHHHQQRTGRRQRLQEVPQDVSQDVQRSVEVGRRRQQPAQPAWAPAGAAYEQRDPWRASRRGVRVTDTFHQ